MPEADIVAIPKGWRQHKAILTASVGITRLSVVLVHETTGACVTGTGYTHDHAVQDAREKIRRGETVTPT